MARMTVHMLGIMYFHVCEENLCEGEQRQVLLPDGTKSDGHVPAHNASLFIEKEQLIRQGEQWHEGEWPGKVLERSIPIPGKKKIAELVEFRIEEQKTWITFPDPEKGKYEAVDLDKGLIPLKDVDPNFVPRLDGEGSIARVPIRSGKLEVYSFNGVSPVQWTIDSATDALTISAGKGTVHVRPKRDQNLGAEVVLANVPDLLAQIPTDSTKTEPHHNPEHGLHAGHDGHHFTLYNKLRKNGDNPDLKLPRHRMNLPNNSVVFELLEHVKMLNSCSGTCCPPWSS